MVIHTDAAETYFWLGVAIPRITNKLVKQATTLQGVAAASLSADQRAAIDARIKEWLATHDQPD
jgi:hypothetical protein